MVIRAAHALNARFLQRLLSSPPIIAEIENASVGSTMLNLNQGTLANLLIPVPPSYAEQEAIADALSDADALVESLEQLLAKKRHIKQGAMQELFTGKKRLPEFSGDFSYKPTDVGTIPTDWDALALGELARGIVRGASPRPIDSPEWFDDRSTIGWVRISDVTKVEHYLFDTTQRLSEAGVRSSRFVPSGSLIMSICATVGRPVETRVDVCIHDGFVVFDRPSVSQAFLYHTLKELEPRWSSRGQTGSQMNLNTDIIKRTKIPVPSTRAEQDAIAAILSDMDAELVAVEAKRTKARQIKQGMMQELLTGRTRLV
jgi:type I restriction enzyme S subunit